MGSRRFLQRVVVRSKADDVRAIKSGQEILGLEDEAAGWGVVRVLEDGGVRKRRRLHGGSG